MKMKLGERLMIGMFFRLMGAVPVQDALAYLGIMTAIDEPSLPIKGEIDESTADAEIDVSLDKSLQKWLSQSIVKWHGNHPVPTSGGSWYAKYMISLLGKLEGGD